MFKGIDYAESFDWKLTSVQMIAWDENEENPKLIHVPAENFYQAIKERLIDDGFINRPWLSARSPTQGRDDV